MPSPERIDFTGLRNLLEEQLGNRLPLAVFRHPDAGEFRLILQETPDSKSFRAGEVTGFLMSPFDTQRHPAVWLAADRVYFYPAPKVSPPIRQPKPIPDPTGRDAHRGLVSGALAEIRRGALEKVVLARRFQIPTDCTAPEVFLRLAALYPQAFCYLWYHPEHGTWLGASPEVLLTYEGGQGTTVALAGTLPANGPGKPSWSPKEMQEQQLVTDFIAQKSRELGLVPRVRGPVSVRAAGLWHLKTEFGFETSQATATDLAEALHPTPAVCGLPREAALDFIRSREPFDREFYCGFLGEMGISGPQSLRLYVNLRCMKLRDGQASIYVGGGITSDSDPQAEWEETQHKSLTMLGALQE